jgi:hypothetical protein
MAFGNTLQAIGGAFGDPLQWLIIGILVLMGMGVIVYILLRILRTLNKADRYFDSKRALDNPTKCQ